MIERIPITVGIIGHLDAIITDDHKKIIARLFDDISARYPHSPVCLFSQLAEGTDTEIAELFLSIRRQTSRDYRLIVPLPYDLDEYKSKLDPENARRFEDLLAAAERYFVIEHHDTHSQSDLYRFGGQFVADSSMILIALWENEDNGKKGGTADIVKYKISGSFEEEVVDNVFDMKSSLISLTCNRKSGDPKSIDLPSKPLLDELLKDGSVTRTLEKVEELNRSLAKMPEDTIRKSENYLFEDQHTLSGPMTMLRRYFAVIDATAIGNQKVNNLVTASLFVLGFIILFFFEWYKHLGLDPNMLIATTGLIVVAYVIFRLSHQWHNHSRFLENRALAEALRIQFFWELGGVKRPVAEYILRIHKAELNWIKYILHAIYGLCYEGALHAGADRQIKSSWLTDQRQYFDKRIALIHRIHKRHEIISRTALALAFAAIVSIFFLEKYYEEHHLLHPIIVVIGSLFGIFAISKGYVEKKGYSQILNQYTLMRDIYASVLQKVAEIELDSRGAHTKRKQLERLYYLAGKEALIENGNWYIVFKEKEPEVEGVGG